MASNRAYCLALAKVERTWLLALKAIVFPADTAADAKLLIRYDAAEEGTSGPAPRLHLGPNGTTRGTSC